METQAAAEPKARKLSFKLINETVLEKLSKDKPLDPLMTITAMLITAAVCSTVDELGEKAFEAEGMN